MEARARVLDAVRPLGTVSRPLLSALGSVLAEEIVSPIDLPPWDNSGMDGFAVRTADVKGASEERPRELRVVDDVAAGATPRLAVEPGTAIRVMTGAPVPGGAEGVIRVEHTDGGRGIGTEDAWVRIHSDQDAGRNIRTRGGDLRRGEVVLRAGTVLGAAELATAAGAGRSQLTVVRQPVVGVLASGDELVDVDRYDEVLARRRIVSTNGYSLAAQLAESGMEVRLLGIARDTPESLRSHLEGARGCDALVTSAGVSVGEHDHVRPVLGAMGLEAAFWRVRMRPGSPVAFGTVAALGGIPWFGLPGNPVSSMVTFELFVRPALLRMSGRTAIFLPNREVVFRGAYPARPGLTHFPRVRLQESGGETVATLTGDQGSGILTSMLGADALAVVPETRPGAAAGDRLTAIILGGRPLRESPGY